MGSLFLFAGFISLFRIHRVVKAAGESKIEKLEQLMVRIGAFSILYTVPAAFVVACHIYELRYRVEWEKSLVCHRCQQIGYRPLHLLFMLKYLMLLVVGITSGFWVWTRKTVSSWASCYQRIFCCRSPYAQYQPADHIIVAKSHTDITSNGYQRHLPLSHVWNSRF